ncbi:MAG: oligopeptide transporter, OPT family [Vicinamibacteraceae bacterium]|nr:oligopeptide transporter, OPT family [Vicinamibacteraceae bacterium]
MEQKSGEPFVPAHVEMPEATPRALVLGVLMAVFMGAANAYLGLKAGMTIAATYTTAVLGMAIIKSLGGTILEENTARTVGSIGGNVAAGAIFTLPAFFIAGIWRPFFSTSNYVVSTIMLVAGGILGILFVTITRRVLVGNAELPFPESVAAAEIHKAGQRGQGGSRHLLAGMGLGAFFTLLTEVQVLAAKWQATVGVGRGALVVRGPEASPAFLGVGYIIGPRLAGINFSGGVLAWGLLAPAIAFFLHVGDAVPVADWGAEIVRVWRDYVRLIAIGGMLVGAFYTLWRMRASLVEGIARSLANLRPRRGEGESAPVRTDRDLPVQVAAVGIGIIVAIMVFVFQWFAGNVTAAIVAAIVMLALAFVFAAVSGYLVGIIGVSSNPTSGLTVTVLISVAFLMVILGLQGTTGVAAVLGVAAFTCVSVSVAGEMMQDLKAGHILGCTPWRMQAGDMLGVTAASLVMFLVLSVLHLGDIKSAVADRMGEMQDRGATTVEYAGADAALERRAYTLDEVRGLAPELQNELLGTNAGFGGAKIPAPQASLMAVVSRSIIEQKTDWILILVGVFMGLAFILMQVKSPMLVSVGMYLPIETSFAIFVGGLFKGLLERTAERRKWGPERKDRAENTGTLLASGLIAGEAIIGILFAALAFGDVALPELFANPSYLVSLASMAIVGAFLVLVPRRETT